MVAGRRSVSGTEGSLTQLGTPMNLGDEIYSSSSRASPTIGLIVSSGEGKDMVEESANLFAFSSKYRSVGSREVSKVLRVYRETWRSRRIGQEGKGSTTKNITRRRKPNRRLPKDIIDFIDYYSGETRNVSYVQDRQKRGDIRRSLRMRKKTQLGFERPRFKSCDRRPTYAQRELMEGSRRTNFYVSDRARLVSSMKKSPY